MNTLSTKLKTLVLLALLGGFTFQCEQKKDDQTATLLLGAALFGSQGDCSVSATGKPNINTWNTSFTNTSFVTLSKTGSIPVIGHTTAVISYLSTGAKTIELAGKANIIVYGADGCPLAPSQVIKSNISYTGDLSADATFADSYLLNGTGRVVITSSTTGVFILVYARPSTGQSANIQYRLVP